MAELILKCEKLNKNFGKKQILKNVNLEINKGDILGFIGPNGAGKTTTIKLILGLQSITSGKVLINGHDVAKDFTKAIERVGAIVENPDLYMYLSGYENLKLIANLYNNIDEKRIQEVISLVKLEKRIKDKVSKYSLGMRQRLGIAQAIIHKPNLLILDEPTNGLDPEGIKEIRDLLLEKEKKEEMAILISSHNLAELDNLCNKVSIIKNGEIIETSNIEQIKNEEKTQVQIFELDDANKVKNINELKNKKIEVIDNQNITIEISKSEVPEIVKILVEQSVKIYSIREKEISLEEAFLKKTGGNVIE